MTQCRSKFKRRLKSVQKPSWIKTHLEDRRIKRLEKWGVPEEDYSYLLMVEKDRSMEFAKWAREAKQAVRDMKKKEATLQSESWHLLNMIRGGALKGKVDAMLSTFIRKIVIEKKSAIDVLIAKA